MIARGPLAAALIAALAGCSIGDGETRPQAALSPPAQAAADVDRFLDWLRARSDADERYVLARFDTRSPYQMTGHAWSAFFGVSEFLARNPDLAAELRTAAYSPRMFWSQRPELRRRFGAFVRTEGHRFPGQDGGDWTTKLPRFLGGTQTSGGAGSGLVARMLILLARYDRGRR